MRADRTALSVAVHDDPAPCWVVHFEVKSRETERGCYDSKRGDPRIGTHKNLFTGIKQKICELGGLIPRRASFRLGVAA